MVMIITFAQRPMCFLKTFNNLITIEVLRKIRTQFGFLNQLQVVAVEELSYLQIMKNYLRIRRDSLLVDILILHFW